jgi:hypothetical protein
VELRGEEPLEVLGRMDSSFWGSASAASGRWWRRRRHSGAGRGRAVRSYQLLVTVEVEKTRKVALGR